MSKIIIPGDFGWIEKRWSVGNKKRLELEVKGDKAETTRRTTEHMIHNNIWDEENLDELPIEVTKLSSRLNETRRDENTCEGKIRKKC